MTAHLLTDPRQLIEHPPVAWRAPYDVPDPTFDIGDVPATHTPSELCRRLVRLDREAALRDPLDGLPITGYESGELQALAEELQPGSVAVLVTLLWRCRQARQLPQSHVSSGRAL